MKYLLIGEKYDRGPGRSLAIKFDAEDDATAALKMCAIAFAGNIPEVSSLTTFAEISNFLTEEVFDEEDVDDIRDELGPETDSPWHFTKYVVESIFEHANGDGMDYFTRLDNLTTDENIWVPDPGTINRTRV